MDQAVRPMTYKEFVSSRIKWLATPQEDIMHASVGLVGEAIELMFYHLAPDPAKNYEEEVGDLEFYYEHAEASLRKIEHRDIGRSISRDELRAFEDKPFDQMIFWTGELLDMAKKAWVYRKDMHSLDFGTPLLRVDVLLAILAQQGKTTRTAIQAANQTKLEKRFPTGYSDAAAQARADKVV